MKRAASAAARAAAEARKTSAEKDVPFAVPTAAMARAAARTAAAEGTEAAASRASPIPQAFVNISAEIWVAIRRDAAQLANSSSSRTIFTEPLWPDRISPLDSDWRTVRSAWSAASSGWKFWIEWYEDALAGRELNWNLLRDIALIPDRDWKAGADHVNALIADMVAKHRTSDAERTEPDIEAELRKAPQPSPETIQNVQRAMDANRSVLPDSLDAVEALILLEIERLQQDNYLNATVPEECQRQIRNYLLMYDAIRRLKARVPDQAPTTLEVAAECAGLVELYWRKLKELPSGKSDEVIEGFWSTAKGIVQGSLILGSTKLAIAYGLPAAAGIAAGSLVFAPSRAKEILSAAKDVLPKS